MSDHPSVLAAVDAVIAREAVYHPGADNSTTREVYAVKSATAVAAAFRERAEHVINDCEDKIFGSRYPLMHRGWDPCKECDGFADMLTYWADEIEASRV